MGNTPTQFKDELFLIKRKIFVDLMKDDTFVFLMKKYHKIVFSIFNILL